MQPSVPSPGTKTTAIRPPVHPENVFKDDPVSVSLHWVMVAAGVVLWVLAVHYLVTTTKAEVRAALASAAATLDRLRHRKLKRLIDEELCRHGLSSDAVLAALLGLDRFSYVMDGKVCTCVRREDGTHDFGFPTPTTVLEIVAAERRVVEVSEVVANARAVAGREAREHPPAPAAFDVGGARVTVTGVRP